MNKIFRVIWNAATQSWVAVSELSKAKGKSASSTDERKSPEAKTLLALSLTGAAVLGMSSSVFAATATNPAGTGPGVAFGTGASATMKSVALGDGANASDTNAIAVGTNATAKGVGDSIAIGHNSSSVSYNGLAIGLNSTSGYSYKNNDVQVRPTDGTVAIGTNSQALGNHSIAIGDSAKTWGHKTIYKNGSIAIGYSSSAVNSQALAVGSSSNASGQSSVALGFNSSAIGDAAVALGLNSLANNTRTTVLGPESTATSSWGVAIGNKALAGNPDNVNDPVQRAIAIGNGSIAARAETTAIGQGAKALTYASIAIGLNAQNQEGTDTDANSNKNHPSYYSVALGGQTLTQGSGSIAIGERTKALAGQSTAIGRKAVANGTGSIVIGELANVANRNAKNAIAIGTQAKGEAEDAIAMGSAANVTGEGSTAIGSGTAVSGNDTVAIGNLINATTSGSVLLGNASNTTGSHATEAVTQATVGSYTYNGFAGTVTDDGKYVSIGAKGDERQIKNVAPGHIDKTSTDAINGSQLYAAMARVEQGWNISQHGGAAGGVANILPSENVDFSNGSLTVATATADGTGAKIKYDVVTQALNTTTANGKAGVGTGNAQAGGQAQTSPNPNALTTAQNVADAINSAYWTVLDSANAPKGNVSAGDKVKFVGEGATTVTVEQEKDNVTTIKISSTAPAAGSSYSFTVKDGNGASQAVVNGKTVEFEDGKHTTASIDSNNGDPKVSFNVKTIENAPVTDQGNINKTKIGEDVVTGKVLADAVNNSFFRATVANTSTGTSNNASVASNPAKIKAGNLVTLEASDGVDIQLDSVNQKYTFSVQKATLTNENGTVKTPEGDDAKKLVDAANVTNAINNSSWAIGDKDGNKIDDINPGDGVNFVDSNTTTATVTKNANGKGANVTFEAKTGELKADTAKPGAITVEEADKAKLANLSTVAKAINESGWNIDIGRDDATFADQDGKKKATVNPSEDVTFKSGKNLIVKQVADGANHAIVFATADNVTFNTVNATNKVVIGNSEDPNKAVTLTANDKGDLTIGKGDKNEPAKITNVAPGEISETSKDAINGSQLYSATANTTLKPNETGKIDTPAEGNKLVNATTVANAINGAGWNLKENGTQKDLVTPSDTVDFVNGQGTKVNVTTVNNVSTIKIDTPLAYVNTDKTDTSNASNAVNLVGKDNNPVSLGNVESGLGAENAKKPAEDFLNELANATGPTLNNAVNVGDLQKTANATLGKAGFNLVGKKVDGSNGEFGDATAKDKRIGTNDNFTLNAGKNIKITQVDDGYEVATVENLDVGNITVGTNGKDGKDGTVGVNGKDGSGVVLNGKDGSIGLTGKPGADGKSPNATISVVEGPKGLAGNDGKDGETKTRIEYKKPDGTTETLATLNDGLKFKGDGDEIIDRPLNTQLDINGGADKDSLTEKNIGVIADKTNNTLNVKLSKDLDLTPNGSIKIGNMTINEGGFNAGNVTISNVTSNLTPADKDATEAPKLPEDIASKKDNAATVQDVLNAGWNLQGNGKAVDFVTHDDTVNFVDGQGTKVTVERKNGVNTIKVDSPLAYVDPENPDDTSNATNTVKLVGKDSTKPVALGNVESGLGENAPKDAKDFFNALVNAPESALNNAVNVSDLKNAIKESGFNLVGEKVADTNGEFDDKRAKDKRINTNNNFTLNAGKNIKISQVDDGYEVSTVDNLVVDNLLVGKPGKDGEDGVDGTIGVAGKDGSGVIINGKDGSIGLQGPKGEDGKSPNAVISVVDGPKGLDGNDGKDGESKTRIEYVKPDGEKETLATLKDGLKFKGDGNEIIDRPLNTQLDIKGGADKDRLTEKNIGVVADPETGSLNVKLAKDINLGPDGSLNVGPITINNNGIDTGNKVITNVSAGANTYDGKLDDKGNPLTKVGDNYYTADQLDPATGKPKEDAKPTTPAAPTALDDAYNGLADLNGSNPTNAATVKDLQNMGWVVSADGNDYADDVRNANRVEFKGEGLAKVTGVTNKETGVREITVSVKTGEVAKSNEGVLKDPTNPNDPGKPVVNVDGKYYDKADINPSTGKPKEGATPVPTEQVQNIENTGAGFVTGNQVADAIQESGWNVGLAKVGEAIKAFTDSSKALTDEKLERVNPNDNVRFADGKNTVAKVATLESVDAKGNKVTDTYVKVDVDLPIDYKYKDKDGNSVAKAEDGKFYPVNPETGLPDTKKPAVDSNDVTKDGVTLTQGNDPVKPYTETDKLKDAAAEKAKEDLLKEKPNATPEEIAAAERDARDNTKGDGGVNLNNVAWAEKPDQAVNLDQLNNSGWELQNNGVKKDKVVPNDKVNFIDGANTQVKVETAPDGKSSTVRVNVVGMPVTYTTKDGDKVAKAADGKFYPVDPSTGLPNTAKPEVKADDIIASMVNPKGDDTKAPTKLANVAEGDISPTSKDAVNGSQLYALGDVVGGDQVTYNQTTGKQELKPDVFKDLTPANGGSTTVNGDEFKQPTNVVNAVNTLNHEGTKYFKANSTEPAAKAEGKNSIAVGPNSVAKVEDGIAMGNNATVTKEAPKGSVAIGEGSTAGKAHIGPYTLDGSKAAGKTGKDTKVFSVGKPGDERQIQNVAPGVISKDSTDAINGSQLHNVVQNVNQKFGAVNNRINRVNKDLRGGIAGAAATAGLPQVYIPGKSMVAAAASTYKNQSAVAVGYSRASDNGKVILKVTGSANTRGDFTGTVGVGYQW